MADMTARDWLTPKLTTLMAEAEADGFARDVVVAVITDVINGPLFITGPVVGDEDYNQDIGEPDYMVNENAPMSAESTGPEIVQNPLAGLTGRSQPY